GWIFEPGRQTSSFYYLVPHFICEIVVNEVNFVKKCISTDNSQDDLWGKLICTNFKVSFIPQDPPQKQVFDGILILYLNDLTYKNIDVTTLSLNDLKGKKKILSSNQKLKFNPTELILYCKDLRIIRFCFDEAGPESARKNKSALLDL
uniref:Uncharacterized protein n=1 Tax=Oryzias sinensis TaxID=183150 RepID=A0A8C7WTF3_9TELE